MHKYMLPNMYSDRSAAVVKTQICQITVIYRQEVLLVRGTCACNILCVCIHFGGTYAIV